MHTATPAGSSEMWFESMRKTSRMMSLLGAGHLAKRVPSAAIH
jgi:hypothetical protein